MHTITLTTNVERITARQQAHPLSEPVEFWTTTVTLYPVAYDYGSALEISSHDESREAGAAWAQSVLEQVVPGVAFGWETRDTLVRWAKAVFPAAVVS